MEKLRPNPERPPKPLDPERLVQDLRDRRSLPAPERREARESAIEEIVEQRIKIGWLIRDLEHAVLTGVTNRVGQNLEEARTEADNLLRPPAGLTRRATERRFEEELEERNLTLDELVSAAKDQRLDERKLKELVQSAAREARLPEHARSQAEAAVTKVVEARRAINYLREEAGDDQRLFRVLFGREPNGKISFIEGPFSLHVRCYDLTDYAWIHSGMYADPNAPIGAEPRPEQLAAADTTGGVALFETRNKEAFLETEPLALADDGQLEPTKSRLLSGALKALEGALTAENASREEQSDTESWRVFRHEERHVRNRLMGQPWAYGDTVRLRELAVKLSAAEGDMERHLLRLRELAADDPGRAAAQSLSQELNQRLDTLIRAAESVIARYAEHTIEDQAKDEILAYYIDGQLEEAVGTAKKNGGLGRKPPTEVPFLRRSRNQGGLYDFHHCTPQNWTVRHIVERLSKTAAEEGLTLGGVSEDRRAELGQPTGRELLESDIRQLVINAIVDHKDNYFRLLDRSVEAVALLERRGYTPREVSDILNAEPLRNWLAMAERITGERERRKKERKAKV